MGFQFSGVRFWVPGLRSCDPGPGFLAFCLIALMMLTFGCLGQPYSSNAGNQTNQTVAAPAKNESQAAQNGTNVTHPGQNNQTNGSVIVTPEPEDNGTLPVITPEPTIPSLNMSIADLMAKQMDKLNPPHGAYSIVAYQWTSGQYDADPMAITINPTMQIFFDNKTETNLIGFGFKTYTPLNGSAQFANGFAITLNESALLESKFGTFETYFNVPKMVKSLHGCTITSKDTMLDNRSRVIVVYWFDAASSE